MTYFTFFKNILLHPIAFLDEYFVKDKKPEEYKQTLRFAYLGLVIFSLFFIFLTIFFRPDFELKNLVAPSLALLLSYPLYKFYNWLFFKRITVRIMLNA